MVDRRKNKDVLWWALQCAKRDRIAFADAYKNEGKEADEAIKDISAFNRLEKELFSKTGTMLDQKLKGAGQLNGWREIKEALFSE